MFDGYDDCVGSRQSRNRGGGRGGARSCSVSVLCFILCVMIVFVFRHLHTILCLNQELPLGPSV